MSIWFLQVVSKELPVEKTWKNICRQGAGSGTGPVETSHHRHICAQRHQVAAMGSGPGKWPRIVKPQQIPTDSHRFPNFGDSNSARYGHMVCFPGIQAFLPIFRILQSWSAKSWLSKRLKFLESHCTTSLPSRNMEDWWGDQLGSFSPFWAPGEGKELRGPIEENALLSIPRRHPSRDS